MRGNKIKKYIILVCVLSVVAVLFSAGYQLQRKQKAKQLYRDIRAQLELYPCNLPADGYSICYYQKGAEEYLFFQSDGATIVGRRNQEDEVYYIGESMCVDKTGAVVAPAFSKQDLLDAIEEGVACYLDQADVTYTYHKPSGGALPMWISPLDPCYLRLQRPGYPDHMEVMTGDDTEKGRYVHWNILAPDESVLLYLAVSDISSTYGRTYVPGWGDIPTQIIDLQLHSEQQ